MERLVSGLAKIKFQQNCEDILVEKRATNMTTWLSAANNSNGESAYNSANDSNNAYDEHAEDVDTTDVDEDTADIGNSHFNARFSERRNLPQRACKENSKLKLKRRSIMKPKRNMSRACDFSMLRPTDIKKIYTNRKLTNFRPTNLETIFEEPQPTAGSSRANVTISADNSPIVRLIGGRKIRRSLSCSDGLNVNKTVAKQRRAKIKKAFGRRCAFKKISLTDFLERLNKSLENDDNNESGTSANICAEPMDSEVLTTEAATNANFIPIKTDGIQMHTNNDGAKELPLIGICDGTDMIYKSTTFRSLAASAIATELPEMSTLTEEKIAIVAVPPPAQFNLMGGIVRL